MLKNLKLPETTALSSIVVTDCASLTEIQLPLKNQVDNAVFSISKCGKIKELDLSSADISSVNIESMSGLEKVSFNSEKKPKYSMNDCEKLTAVTRFLASDSTIDYETCPELKDVYYYEETSERPQIHDVMKLALYGVTVHCRKSNTELISCLRKYSVDIAFIGETKLKGDANCDDEVNLADAVFIMQTVSAPDKYKLSECGAENADVDASGDITNMDALLIQRYKLGIIDEL